MMNERRLARHEVIMAGVGGRGVLMAGLLLAQAGLPEYGNVVWLPSYASAMRGGPCECTVILSQDGIASPVLSRSQAIIIVEPGQLQAFEGRVRPGGIAVVESSGLSRRMQRDDVTAHYVPAVEKAVSLGNPQVANLVLLGMYLGLTGAVSPGAIDFVLEKRLAGRGREKLLDLNKRALREGVALTLDSG